MTEHISIKVLYFAALKDVTGVPSEQIQVPATLQIKDLIPHLLQEQGLLATERGRAIIGTCACAIDLEYVDLQHDTNTLRNGAEVALIPPVSGG